MNQKADYGEIAQYYDRGRTLSDSNLALWLDLVKKHAAIGKETRVLDLGCGTGRFALPFAEKLGWKVTGCDTSPEMLAKAREKDAGNMVAWQVEDAHHLSIADRSFDIVFVSLVLHHCEDPALVVRECSRVLVPGGTFFLRHAVYDEIKHHCQYVFFPESRAIGELRLLPAEKVVELFRDAGFEDIGSEMVVQKSHESSTELLRRFSGKSLSTLSVIPEEAFRRGLERLKDYVRLHPDDPWLLEDRLHLTVGRKPA